MCLFVLLLFCVWLQVRFELGLFDPVAEQPWWQLGEQDIGPSSPTLSSDSVCAARTLNTTA